MAVTASFSNLVKTFSGVANKNERRAVAYLLPECGQTFEDDFVANCRSARIPRQTIDSHASLVMAIKTLWSITPEKLFTAADPNFERLADNALRVLSEQRSQDDIQGLSRVFRNLRNAHKTNRTRVSGLNLERGEHSRLLAHQGGRCAACGYEFTAFELNGEEFEEEVYIQERCALAGEVIIERYNRKPHLDHIIPHFLGGDSPDNWQILCGSCNAGKGEGLSWIFRRGFLPPARPAEALTISTSLRYAVLARHQGTIDATPSSELRIFRINDELLPVFENLIVRTE